VSEREGSAGVGMMEQSLCHHLHSQLTEYYRLIAVLESQMNLTQEKERSNPREEEMGLTLRRLDVWITDWKLRMRMMSVCVEGARGKLFDIACEATTKTCKRHAWRRPCQPHSQFYE
jgi:gamma-tubulin complex component 3